jgi:molybdate transport system substrate-binding protein
MTLRSVIRRARVRTAGLLALVLLVVVAVSVAAACSGDSDSGTTPTASDQTATAATSPSASSVASAAPSTPAVSGDIAVFAAASLTDAFTEVGKQFEAANPGTKVTFNFAGSSALATQINQGAPADVFASADTKQMKVVTDAGGAESPVNFATNVPVVVVPKDDTAVRSFENLAKPGIKLILAAPEVPIGNYARQILTNATGDSGISATFSDDVLKNLQSNESDVKAVLAKIQVGEADAGIVYATDAATVKDDVKTIDIPQQYNVVAQYPIAPLTESKHTDVANAFVDYLTSDAGEAILKRYGFGSAG